MNGHNDGWVVLQDDQGNPYCSKLETMRVVNIELFGASPIAYEDNYVVTMPPEDVERLEQFSDLVGRYSREPLRLVVKADADGYLEFSFSTIGLGEKNATR